MPQDLWCGRCRLSAWEKPKNSGKINNKNSNIFLNPLPHLVYHLLHVFAPPANLISGWSQQRAKRTSPSLVEEWAATGAVRATPTPVRGCFGGGGGLEKGTWQFIILLIKNEKTPVVVFPPRWNECCGSSVRHPVEVLDALGEVLPASVGVKVWQDMALPLVRRGAAGHAVGQAEAAELLKQAELFL